MARSIMPDGMLNHGRWRARPWQMARSTMTDGTLVDHANGKRKEGPGIARGDLSYS
jgi:hypothetical protein